MKLAPHMLDLDWADVETRVTSFIRDYVQQSGAKGVVLGLSGGIDSCTTAALSAKALGGKNVLALMLPEIETRTPEDIRHAELVTKRFKLEAQTRDITQTLKAFYKSVPVFDHAERVWKGNVKARMRMAYVYYYANKLGLLVCGSSDKSEAMMGYFTKWGDIAADISPLMDLYKTQVRKLASHIGIPNEIITKPSSPALWPGQTAEEELGIKYDILDLILYGLERFMDPEEIAKQIHVKEGIVRKVRKRWLSSEHKRRMLLTTKLGYRTVGMDFRLRRA